MTVDIQELRKKINQLEDELDSKDQEFGRLEEYNSELYDEVEEKKLEIKGMTEDLDFYDKMFTKKEAVNLVQFAKKFAGVFVAYPDTFYLVNRNGEVLIEIDGEDIWNLNQIGTLIK